MMLRIILGGLYVAMGIGQLLSWQSMPEILGAYGVAPAEALPWLAAVLIAAELVAGVMLLARPRSSRLAPVWAYTAVALLWTVLGVQAYARGLAVDNCGCFGLYLSQRLSWFTLVQDGLLLAYAGLMIRAGLRARATPAETVPVEGRKGAHRRVDDGDGGSSMRVRAMWNGVVLADSDDTVVVEGNHYFPPDSVNWQYFQDSPNRTVCPWKGVASYHTVVVDGSANPDAAWYYPDPSQAASEIKDRLAFWRGVKVETVTETVTETADR